MHRLVTGVMVAVAGHVSVAQAAGELAKFDPARVKAGGQVYEQYCASCHGARAQGASNWQERDEHGELPAPPHNAEGHTWRHSDAQLYEMVSKGLRHPFNKTKRLTMPAFGDVLAPEQIVAVITYLKTLWTPDQGGFQAEETRDHPVSAQKP